MNTEPIKQEFVKLIQENKGIIFKICHSYCDNRNGIDDLSQEIVYNLWKAFHNYNPHLKFSTWMYRIALNVAISFYRKENKAKPWLPFSESLILFDDTKDTNNDAEENFSLLQQFISRLKEIDKSIILLYLDDKSYKEIAEITGITESNVATKINRIKDNLRSKFEAVKSNQYGTK